MVLVVEGIDAWKFQLSSFLTFASPGSSAHERTAEQERQLGPSDMQQVLLYSKGAYSKLLGLSGCCGYDSRLREPLSGPQTYAKQRLSGLLRCLWAIILHKVKVQVVC